MSESASSSQNRFPPEQRPHQVTKGGCSHFWHAISMDGYTWVNIEFDKLFLGIWCSKMQSRLQKSYFFTFVYFPLNLLPSEI